MTRISLLIAALAAAVATSAAQGELILHSKGHFQGPSISATGPRQKLPPFTAKSVTVPPGEDWELCTGNTFTGCRRFSKSVAAMAMTVRSVRPVGGASIVALPGGAASGIVLSSPPSPSLRGFESEFFVAPEASGNRIEVKPASGKEMNREADTFCKRIGWKSAAHAALQTANGTAFLADVLCV